MNIIAETAASEDEKKSPNNPGSFEKPGDFRLERKVGLFFLIHNYLLKPAM
jgi:hypothetical protein